MRNKKQYTFPIILLHALLLVFGCAPAQNLSKPAFQPIKSVGISAPAPPPAAPAQQLTVTIGGAKYIASFSGEIALAPIGGDTVTVPPIVNGTPDRFFGTNTFPWVPLDKLTMFGTLRCYIASGWIWRPGGLFVQPLYQAETEAAHGLDDYFTAAKAKGFEVLPCINLTPDWYAGVSDGSGSNPYPPIKPGLSRTDPKSYADYAEFWYQFCARYGSTKHLDSELRVDTTPKYQNQPKNLKKSGLGHIKFVEIGNEWDRWWDKGTDKYLTPQEHAAMLIAVVEAIRRADPNMVIVMGGLTGFDMPYLLAMDAAFKAAGKPWPDVINVHHYSHEGNRVGVWPPTWWNSGATYPENDKDFLGIGQVVMFAKGLGRPVWVTEFGADTKPPSWMHVSGAKFGLSDEQAQGQLIVKTFQKYAELGVQRACIFTAVNERNAQNGGLWQNSGILTGQDSGYRPKESYGIVRDYIQSVKSKPR